MFGSEYFIEYLILTPICAFFSVWMIRSAIKLKYIIFDEKKLYFEKKEVHLSDVSKFQFVNYLSCYRIDFSDESKHRETFVYAIIWPFGTSIKEFRSKLARS